MHDQVPAMACSLHCRGNLTGNDFLEIALEKVNLSRMKRMAKRVRLAKALGLAPRRRNNKDVANSLSGAQEEMTLC